MSQTVADEALLGAAPQAARDAARDGVTLHALRADPAACFWGFYDKTLPPVLTVGSGDVVYVEALTPLAGDAPDLLMDEGTRAVYEGIPPEERGPGPHVMTGPIALEGAEPGDTLEVRILSMAPRLPYGSNVAGWWGGLYEDFQQEFITVWELDSAAGLVRAAFTYEYTASERYPVPPVGVVEPDPAGRRPTLQGISVPLRPHFGIAGVAPEEDGKVSSVPPWRFGGNLDNWRIGPGGTMYYPVFNPGALFYVGDPHLAEGDGELDGTAIEASANAWLQLILRKHFPVTSPILETATHWYTHGFDEDLNLAMKMAAREMLEFLARRHGLMREEAYGLVSVVGDLGVTQVVDLRQGIHCGIPKSVFSAS
jgi:acetamidase/formamidase